MTHHEANEIAEKYTTLPSDVSFDQLFNVLIDGKIPVDEYGKGNAKTINHLLSEINEGEAIITIDSNGNVYREVNVLWADVVCEISGGNVYLLKEDRQEFKDGRIKRRELDSSIGEKIKPSESPQDAAQRALSEELGITGYESLHKTGYDERTFIPDTFPGIKSTYKMHQYVAVIPERMFNPAGYIEYQADKTNFYIWTLIHTNANQPNPGLNS